MHTSMHIYKVNIPKQYLIVHIVIVIDCQDCQDSLKQVWEPLIETSSLAATSGKSHWLVDKADHFNIPPVAGQF